MPISWKPKPEALAGEETEIALLMKALAHPVRVRILRILRARPGCPAGELADALPVAPSTVSQHLKIMIRNGLLHQTAQGTRRCYHIDSEVLERLRRYAGSI